MRLKKKLYVCLIFVIIVLFFQYTIENKKNKNKNFNKNKNVNKNKNHNQSIINNKNNNIFNNNNNNDNNKSQSLNKFVVKDIEKNNNNKLNGRINNSLLNNNNNKNKNRSYKRRDTYTSEDDFDSWIKNNNNKDEGGNINDNEFYKIIYKEYQFEKELILNKTNRKIEFASSPSIQKIINNKNNNYDYDFEWKNNKTLNPLLLSKPFIFIHIPKTGGTSLENTFEINLPKKSQLFKKHASPTIKQAEECASKNIDAMFGHFVFGLHYYFQNNKNYTINNNNNNNNNNGINFDINNFNNDDYLYHQNPYSYMTMMRNPIDRVVSHYYFLKNSPDHPLYGEVASISLQDWIEFSQLARNEQCRRIVGISRSTKQLPFDFKEQCIFRLKYTFKFIGLTERFDESLLILSYKTGFNKLSFISKNIGKNRNISNINNVSSSSSSNLYNLENSLYERIKSLNSIDLEVYNIAIQLFEKQINLIGKNNFYNELNYLIKKLKK
ncbi:hypothetical protein DDB_G0274685 [Dictyostelium discoideum AX4]|uniref:Uncharacterized protein n=1 Tax=Dictyostelium discoideum TaxID=44689 RepID=Q555K2_DICDI|nr:hypothetical protein DDB_G0274685 [Dictyostelium discoideum AX4]EAL70235.1 hypothetical protein DDB_G0274685 [Dictyostelium discoideum AX4]|eukprot:XP_644065.1 hypothetical protein DDB_G0274685 [Dictyostelium discoideum AX4]